MKEAVALKSLADQDWKTQLAQGYCNIPAGALIQVENEDFRNLYGSWCEVYWNNRHYYVSKNDISFAEADIEYAKRNAEELNKYERLFKKV